MNILKKNFTDVYKSVLPVAILVLLGALFLVDTPVNMIWDFIAGAIFLIAGLSIFLTGIHIGVEKIADSLGGLIKNFGARRYVVLYGFLIGFIITIAEPNLMVLAQTIQGITGVNKYIIVITASIGFGIVTGFGILRILEEFSLRKFFSIIYGITFIVFFTQPNLIRNIAFEASSASTGVMTTPFILALAMGVSKIKGSDQAEIDSFGMVGVASSGPVFAILTLGMFLNVGLIGQESVEVATNPGFMDILFNSLVESCLAILPVSLLFFIINFFKLKLDKKKRRKLTLGLLYSFIGLILFLTGVYMGFTELAFHLGKELYLKSQTLFLVFGFITGLLVVLAEPSVRILINQVEDVTSGSIDKRLLLVALSIGVGSAIVLAGLRLVVDGFQLWMYLPLGFFIAHILMFKVDPIFVGISFDAGGVASGPMTATFVLALMQGAASVSTVGDKMVNGFGVIASVAMAPIVSMMILGLIYSKGRK